MSDCVEVQANARLHLGFFDLNGSLGRRFGSLGLAITAPVTSLVLRRASVQSYKGPDHQRVAVHVATLCEYLGIANSFAVTVHEAIPAHAGLGSGTQLALAVASALRQLEGIYEDAKVDAILLQRGARSGAGAALFRDGGLIVDGGHAELQSQGRESPVTAGGHSKAVPPVITRLPFPENWRIILVMDPEIEGVHGGAEREAFGRLPLFTEAQAGEICRSVLMQALPAVVERDLPSFGRAISHIQRILGDYFAPTQGGSRFTSPRVGEIMRRLEAEGAHGIGQSSWGPTGFAFASSASEAERLSELVAEASVAMNLKLLISRPANRGAVTRVVTRPHV